MDETIRSEEQSDRSVRKDNRDSKRQQFTNKQRMDMYAFCVLELEMNSNKVSIKKQQQAIQKVLFETKKESHVKSIDQKQISNSTPLANVVAQSDVQILAPTTTTTTTIDNQDQSEQPTTSNDAKTSIPITTSTTTTTTTTTTIFTPTTPLPGGQRIAYMVVPQNGESSHSNSNTCTDTTNGGVKTLLQLQQEVASSRRCYSDYQKTQVLTSSMLRDVQKRFSKYYPDAAIPSRSTIKHVFEKCVTHGTVENIKTPRRPTKITQGDEIEYLLVHEPQMSLRQLAQKLNVSTGTVSRRCKALGLVPESVTLKHQQIAASRRQKQIKQMGDTRGTSTSNKNNDSKNGNNLETVSENNNDLNGESNDRTNNNNMNETTGTKC